MLQMKTVDQPCFILALSRISYPFIARQVVMCTGRCGQASIHHEDGLQEFSRYSQLKLRETTLYHTVAAQDSPHEPHDIPRTHSIRTT
jgi:hypothetical protein